MNSHPSPGSTQTPPTSRPENEDDDPVGDNQPVTGSTDRDAPDAPDAHSDDDSDEDSDEDSQGDSGESNSGAVRTGDDGGSAPRRSSDDDPAEVPEEVPEGSDARPDDRLNDHQEEDFASGRAGRRPASDSKLPQHSRG